MINMEYIYATRYIRTITTGLSKPVVLKANDNNEYVVKFVTENYSKNKVLINDIICSRLAKKVGIFVPNVEKLYIPEILINVDDVLKARGVTEGLHFASLYYKNTVGFLGESLLKNIVKIDQIPKIIAFDLWVGNDDRANNPGNLLFTTEQNSRVIAIDYGNSFNGPDWDSFDLNDDIIMPPFDGEVYSCLKKYIIGNNPFDEICNKIEAISYGEIQECIDEVPEPWLFNQLDRKLILEFLYSRKMGIRPYLNEMQKDGQYFPLWRR